MLSGCGFSLNAEIFVPSPTEITPNCSESFRAHRMPATVTVAPLSMC